MACTCRVCMVYDHEYSMLFVKGNPTFSHGMLTKITQTAQQLWALNIIIF